MKGALIEHTYLLTLLPDVRYSDTGVFKLISFAKKAGTGS